MNHIIKKDAKVMVLNKLYVVVADVKYGISAIYFFDYLK